jgi:ring-1,2-phenylacetyl-CoA epoxidase subunit PaaE
MSKYHLLKIKDIVRETPDTVTIHFKQPLFGKIKYKSGQYITLLVAIDGKNYRRCYSICSSSETDDTLAVAVKRVENGIVSNYLNDKLNIGDKLEIMSPMGNFVFEPQSKSQKHLLLIGAGSGITPLMSMIKTCLSAENSSKITLLYGSRDKKGLIFENQLNDLVLKSKGRLRVVHFLSKDAAGVNGGISGRISADAIYAQTKDIDAKNAVAYLCGPNEMMDMAQLTLKNAGFAQVMRESFYLDTKDINADLTGLVEREVTILLEGGSYKLRVAPDTKILDAALELDMNMPYSCRSGLCTACRCKLESGKVSMEISDVLSDSEIAAGYILTCQAHPLTDDVVISV